MLRFGAAVLLFCVFSGMSYASSCTGQVRQLTDLNRRASSYQIKSSSEPFISDSTLLSGWYVANDNVRYYTILNGTEPDFTYCGTYNPIYIKDKVGELDEGKEYPFIACLVDFDSSCKYSYNVKIRRCGQIFQYFLLPSDGTSAYCFEPSSITAIDPAPNYKIPGSIQISVALMYIRKQQHSEPELDFKCNFASASDQYYYGVSWIINDRVEKTYAPVMKTDLDETNLNETTLRKLGFKFGITIQCAVRISSTVSGNQTNPQMSDTFYAGIKVLTPQLTLSSGSSGNISLQPTIPLGCRRPDNVSTYLSEPCEINIKMFDPHSTYSCQDSSVATLNDQKVCGSKMTGWRNTTSRLCMHQHNVDNCSYSRMKEMLNILSMHIIVTNDQLIYKNDKTFTVQLNTGDLVTHSFWKNARLDDVTVLYTGGSLNTEWRGKVCSVVNDPTLTTFDGLLSTYMGHSSHYLMYRNTKNLAEVQLKNQMCDADNGSYTSSCTCAAAIQAGGDVFVIDICSKIKRAAFSNCRGNVLNVREIYENSYNIYLPTGTKIEVKIGFFHTSNFLRVYVYPSPSDVNNTEGLCGNLNGRQDQIVNDVYFKTWELQQSLFNTVRYNLQSFWIYDHNVCICPWAKPNATSATLPEGHNNSLATCFTQQYATCTDNINLQGEKKNCTIRNKRSVERHIRNNERLLALSISEEERFKTRVRKRAINTNLTEAEAYDECLNVFKSKATYNMRTDLPDIGWNESLSACVIDMMVDGRDFWKEESYNSWVSVITQEIGRNGTFRKEKSDTVQNFESVTCPSQCNGNGKCVNGSCICKEDYVGVSCFVNKSAPLELTDIEGGGECDLADGDDCHECLHFHTKNLIKEFKCKIETNELDENGTVIHTNKIELSGEYESVFDGYCCPSTVEKRRKKRDVTTYGFTVRYSVSISNDGVHFGRSRYVHVFNSMCQSYLILTAGDLLFRLKPNTCYIDGQCYKDGENNNVNASLICCSSVAGMIWTTRKDCLPPAKTPDNSKDDDKIAIVAGSVVSGIVIAACVVFFAIWTYKSKARGVATTDIEPPECHEYTELDFANMNYSGKIHDNGKLAFQREQLNIFTTDYDYLGK